MPEPKPPSASGTNVDKRRASFSALMASTGKRGSLSTPRAAGAATSTPMRAAAATWLDSVGFLATVWTPSSSSRRRGELGDGSTNRSEAFEDTTLQHPIRKFDIERALQREHHVDARMRGQ